MANQVLRNKSGRRIGEIEVRSDGKIVGRDAMGRRKGEYDLKTNITRDEMGQRVGEGNQLSSLIASSL